MRLKVQVNNNNVVKELCAHTRQGHILECPGGVGVHFFEGEESPGDREYAFLFLKYEYYTLI